MMVRGHPNGSLPPLTEMQLDTLASFWYGEVWHKITHISIGGRWVDGYYNRYSGENITGRVSSLVSRGLLARDKHHTSSMLLVTKRGLQELMLHPEL